MRGSTSCQEFTQRYSTLWEVTQRYSTMRELTKWYSTTIYEMPRGDSTLLHSSNYYISSAARTHVLGFLSFKHRHLANYEHHKKVQSWQLVYINNQNLTENLPKFCDSSPMMSLILFLIWRLSSKAITQSAFCTYVSEIYFYTFDILIAYRKSLKHVSQMIQKGVVVLLKNDDFTTKKIWLVM